MGSAWDLSPSLKEDERVEGRDGERPHHPRDPPQPLATQTHPQHLPEAGIGIQVGIEIQVRSGSTEPNSSWVCGTGAQGGCSMGSRCIEFGSHLSDPISHLSDPTGSDPTGSDPISRIPLGRIPLGSR